MINGTTYLETLKQYRRYPHIETRLSKSVCMRPAIANYVDLQFGARKSISSGPSPAEGYLPWPGVLLVGELAQVPHYPER